MECLGIKVDLSKNDNVMGEDIILSTPDSKMAVVVVTTDEEFVIASDTFNLVK
jgi:acetate kinase